MPSRHRHWPIFMLLASCSFDTSGVIGGPIDSGGMPLTDGIAPDMSLIDGPPCVSWPALNVDPCDPALPQPTVFEVGGGSHTFDTDTGLLDGAAAPSAVLAQGGGPEVMVLNVSTMNFDGTLVVTGSRPLVIVVHGNATITGTIDVAARSSINGSRPGPGGNSSACGNSTGDPGGAAGTVSSGGGGGGGAGYGDDGGDGGDGEGAGGAKGAKGTKNNDADLVPLRGGCSGGRGGDDSDGAADTGGVAGAGGGAVEITALGTIAISGDILAGGGGGTGGGGRAGGGGGGSGGGILIDGDTVTLSTSASLCANGGGGGEGGTLDVTGSPGDPGTCSETNRAGGGNGAHPDAGNGGTGGAASDTAGDPANPGLNGAGGGGGGAGVGRIRIQGRSTAATVPSQATVSPTAVP